MKHFDYIMKKQNDTIHAWHEIMSMNGTFKDFEKVKQKIRKIRNE